MDINSMTRKQFEELPILDASSTYACDSLVLLPTRRHHSSGFNYYSVVVCNIWEAVGKMEMYDTVSIHMEDKFNRVGIDCLRASGLMRIFFPRHKYEAVPAYHEIRKL